MDPGHQRHREDAHHPWLRARAVPAHHPGGRGTERDVPDGHPQPEPVRRHQPGPYPASRPAVATDVARQPGPLARPSHPLDGCSPAPGRPSPPQHRAAHRHLDRAHDPRKPTDRRYRTPELAPGQERTQPDPGRLHRRRRPASAHRHRNPRACSNGAGAAATPTRTPTGRPTHRRAPMGPTGSSIDREPRAPWGRQLPGKNPIMTSPHPPGS